MPPPDWIPADLDSTPPSGWVLVEETPTEKYWVNPQSLKDGEPKSTLTEAQLLRVLKLRLMFAKHDPLTLEEWVDTLRRESDPEVELRVWEHLAEVYEDELAARPNADASERELLYYVLVTASSLLAELRTTDDVIAIYPEAEGLPRLTEVVEKCRVSSSDHVNWVENQ
jgi:hypothetical protein